MTIRLKIFEAWAHEKEVDVYRDKGESHIRGFIKGFDTSWRGEIYLKGDSFDGPVEMCTITDIRFVGEVEVDLADEGSIMGDFQKERTAALSEMFDNPDPETSIYPTTAFYARLDLAVEKALERQRHVIQSTITLESPGSEPTETEPDPPVDDVVSERKVVDRSYPHCDEIDCLQRQGGGLYCKREECDTRRIFVDYAGSLREDPKRGEEKLESDSYMGLFKHGPCDEPPADDVASEVWEACKSKNGYYVIEDADGLELVCRTTATPEQMARMAAAPEMRDALEMVSRKSRFSRITVGGCVVDRISVEFNPDQWRIITSALKKADGGE